MTLSANKICLIVLLLFSPLLWAEVSINSQELSALKEIERHIESGSLFTELRRTNDPEEDADLIASFGVDENGHVASLNLTRLTYNNLDFLRSFPQLRFLAIKRSPSITTMHGIESNTQLEKVWLMEVPVTRIEGLNKMERLRGLSIYEGQLTSMEGVKNLTSLQNLVLSRNNLQRFEGLEKLEALEYISVKNNPIDSMKGLGNKPNLEDLHIYRTNIRRLEDYDSLSDANIVVDRNFPFEDNQGAINALKGRGVDVYTP